MNNASFPIGWVITCILCTAHHCSCSHQQWRSSWRCISDVIYDVVVDVADYRIKTTALASDNGMISATLSLAVWMSTKPLLCPNKLQVEEENLIIMETNRFFTLTWLLWMAGIGLGDRGFHWTHNLMIFQSIRPTRNPNVVTQLMVAAA